MSENLFRLSEEQFARLKLLLPDKVRGVSRVDDRRVISGIVHVLKSGCRWADAPSEYGPRNTLYNCWRRWAEKGHWIRIFEALADEGDPPSQALIDSSAVRAHHADAGQHQVQEILCRHAVRNLPARQGEADQATEAVRERMDFRRSPTTRSIVEESCDTGP